QWIYREAAALRQALAAAQQEIDELRQQRRQADEQRAELALRLTQAVVLDAQKQEELACVGQARGVTLRDCRELVEVLIPGQTLGVAELGRRTHAAGQRAGALLGVLDEVARTKVREAAADEIYVKDPVLMIVEPDSLCWLSGRRSEAVSGEAWARELRQLPNLEEGMRDGGTGLAKGVALVNEQRHGQAHRLLTDQGDHFHALRAGSVGLHQAQRQASRALAAAEAADKQVDACARQGQSRTVATLRARHAWRRAEQAMDAGQQRQQVWQETRQALQLFTPDGTLNTRAQAEAVLAETLPQLPDSGFAKSKRQLQQPEMLNYLDRMQEQLAALPLAEEVKQAAVRQEGLRRRPDALQGANPQAAALRGVLLLCAVVLSKAGDAGVQATAAVKDLVRRAYWAGKFVGMHKRCLTHAASRQPPNDARTVGPQTPVVELPHLPGRPSAEHNAL